MIRGILSAALAVLVWGVTFANTRALLFDFSALEIQVIRFAIAWVALLGMELAGNSTRNRQIVGRFGDRDCWRCAAEVPRAVSACIVGAILLPFQVAKEEVS